MKYGWSIFVAAELFVGLICLLASFTASAPASYVLMGIAAFAFAVAIYMTMESTR